MKDVLPHLFIFEVDLYLTSKKINAWLLFLELKLGTKEGTANERTHLHIFAKFVKKNQRKKCEIADEKKCVKLLKKLNRKVR